jgi:hypothetical protein
MSDKEPATELCAAYSGPGTTAVEWTRARRRMDEADVFWLSTVRPDGRPHVTTVIAAWHDGALYFTTGPDERKARNLAENRQCVLMTGGSKFEDGLDVVLEGEAAPAEDEAERWGVADVFEAKYGPHMQTPDGTWAGLGDVIRAGGNVLVYRVAPSTAFGFDKGERFSQTRWKF